MKKSLLMILLLAVMVFAVCFSGCGKIDNTEPSGNQTEAATETQISTEATGYQIPEYTEKEIQTAIDVAKEKFNKGFEGCELQRMEYIEGKYLSDYEYYAKRCAVDRVIVLESDFYAGPDAPASLNQNHLYDNWKWILIDDGSGWKVWTNGYA